MQIITLLTILVTCVLASPVSTPAKPFDTTIGEGKRNYNCLTILRPTVAASPLITGKDLGLRISGKNTTSCAELSKHLWKDTKYRVELFNNPRIAYVSSGAQIIAEQRLTLDSSFINGTQLILVGGSTGYYLPWVEDDSKWYLSVSTVLADQPQFPSVFATNGPFRIQRS